MNLDPVTLRWAEALYGLAKRQGALDAVQRDAARLSAALAGPGGHELDDPRLERQARRTLTLAKAGAAHVLLQNFVNLAFDRRRESVLRGLAAALQRIEQHEKGIATGVVESARPLGASEIALLQREIGARLAKQVVLEQKLVPELVGGVRVTAANRMIDWSVQGRLEALRRKMMEARLPSAN